MEVCSLPQDELIEAKILCWKVVPHYYYYFFSFFRYGQTKPVFAYRLMAHGTMEEKIYKRQVMGEEQNSLGQSLKRRCYISLILVAHTLEQIHGTM